MPEDIAPQSDSETPKPDQSTPAKIDATSTPGAARQQKFSGDGKEVGAIRHVTLVAAGAWLIFLSAAAVTVAAIIFSATQFQGRLATLTLYGGPLSAWKADQLRDQWAASLQVLDAAKKALADKQQSLAKSYALRADLAEQDLKQQLNTDQILNRLLSKIARFDKDIQDRVKDFTVYDAIQAIAPSLDAYKAKDKTIEQDFEDVKIANDKWISVRDQMQARDKERATLSADIENAKRELEDAQKKTHLEIAPRDGTPASTEQSIQIENTIYEFQQMHEFYRSIYSFVLAPSDLLILLLVISMGILGSSMQLTYVYLTEFGAKPTTFYLFRPFLGVIMAFVVFIVTKAGIPLVSDVSRTGGNASANPYFISFLGIISGLLSEKALAWVQRIGSSYFRDEPIGEQQRWARQDLTGKFEAAKRDPKELKALMAAKDEDITQWVEGKGPVLPAAQTIIAAMLGESRRELFTDLPPESGDIPKAG